jgi:PadR family transcriptional regulator, regulatory protein PadR
MMNAMKLEEREFPALSGIESFIIDSLIENNEMFGLEMVDRSNGILKKGTIYVTLSRMFEKGLVESREEARIEPEIGNPRRKYKATVYGERVFKAQALALRFLNLG